MHIAPDIVHCIGWVALSSLCFRPYKWYIFCDDMILATCHSHRILIWWSSYHHTAQKIYSWKEGNSRTSTIILLPVIFVKWWSSFYVLYFTMNHKQLACIRFFVKFVKPEFCTVERKSSYHHYWCHEKNKKFVAQSGIIF